MAQQRSTNAKICKCWGYTFEWIDGLHSSVEQLHSIMLNYDKLVDECLDRLDEISPPGSARTESTGSTDTKTPKRDLYSLLEKHAKDDPKLDELWSEINTVPDWVDWEQIKRGQEVFFRYGTPILNVVSPCMVQLFYWVVPLMEFIARLSKPPRRHVRLPKKENMS